VQKKRDNSLLARKLSLQTTSGGRIRTSDLRVMGPTSYQTALPRGHLKNNTTKLSFQQEQNQLKMFSNLLRNHLHLPRPVLIRRPLRKNPVACLAGHYMEMQMVNNLSRGFAVVAQHIVPISTGR
jgi:hypothetical protein